MSPNADASASTMSPAADTDLSDLLHQGFIILPDLIGASDVARLASELEPWLRATPRCLGDFYGWRTTRINSVLFKAPSSHALALHPRILQLMQAILGSHCDWFQLNLSQVIQIHAGERAQFPHRDDDMWPCPKTHEYMVNVMWALSEFNADNGATLLWRAGDDPASSEPISACMCPGSALIYLGSTQHCAGSNRTAEPRTGLVFSYSLGWLKPYENPFLAYPPKIARTFPSELRDLIGYRIHRPNLGHYEGQDPKVALSTHPRTLPTIDALPPEIARQLSEYYSGLPG